jgi:CAAX protease family protein
VSNGATQAPLPGDESPPVVSLLRRARFATALRGFGPAGLLAMLLILAGTAVTPLFGALLVLLWAWQSRTPWSDLGFARPRTWSVTIAAGLLFGAAFKLMMKALVMPLFGADPVNRAFHYLAGNRAAIPAALFSFIFGAGFAEEIVFRGYFFERFYKRFGTGRAAKIATVLITSTLFAAAHYQGQGISGTEQAAVVGTVFAIILAITGRIWVLMFAHAAFDLTAYALIYWNLEARVAHFLFH